MTDDTDNLRRMLIESGAIRATGASLRPLTGGVSSEIYLVEDGGRRFVVKRALAKLRVEQDWRADTSRNLHEWNFIQYVAAFRPDAMPKLLFHDPINGYFAMEFLDGFSNWKNELLKGQCAPTWAGQAGSLLGEIHQHSWGDQAASLAFDTTDNFDQLRIDPYLRATAERHPDLREKLLNEATRLGTARYCLVHGDYSPKNLLHDEGRLVALDCEVAWYGDPAFDLAFLLNHLILKSLHHAPGRVGLDALIRAATDGYRRANAHAAEVESRASWLLPMLMLARVDGKSPVEYLGRSPAKQDFARAFARRALARSSALDLGMLASVWFDELERFAP